MNSKELKKKAAQEDNDLIAMGIYRKAKREESKERFIKIVPRLLAKGYNITSDTNKGKETIHNTNWGIIDYYPKADKVLIRKSNEWIRNGFFWIKKELCA